MTATVDPVPVIRTRGLGKVYSPGTQAEVVALKGADLRLGRGAFVAIIGQSGTGQSTLIHINGRLDTPRRPRWSRSRARTCASVVVISSPSWGRPAPASRR